MIANELLINTFLQAPNVQFVIPVCQRNYDWTNMNEFMISNLPKFKNALLAFIRKIK